MAPGFGATEDWIAPFEFFSSMVFVVVVLPMTFSLKNSRVPEAESRPITTIGWPLAPTSRQFAALPE